MMTLRDKWLARDPLPADPLPLLSDWQSEAFEQDLQPNPHAIALATVDPQGHPSVRMVLCKRIDTQRGEVVFYSDRRSRKGQALAANPRAAAVFYWAPQNRQARVEGVVRQVDAADADAYFASRPSDSQVGAWASHQSQPLASRRELELRVEAEAKRLGVAPGDAPSPDVPRPPHWVGYAMQLDTVELWVSRPGRIHDRAVWTRRPVGAVGSTGSTGPIDSSASNEANRSSLSSSGWGPWSATRLQP